MTGVELLQALRLARDAVSSDLAQLLAQGDVHPSSNGSLTARDARDIFTKRQLTTRKARIETYGFDHVLQELRSLADEERVLFFGYKSSTWYFAVFVREIGARVLGSLTVRLRPTGRESGDRPS